MGTLALNTVKFENRRRNSSLVQKTTKEDLKVKTSLRKIQQKTPLKIRKITKQKDTLIAIPKLPIHLESKIS